MDRLSWVGSLKVSSLVVAAASGLLVSLAISLMRRFASQAFATDHPGERSSHVRPTARGGGIAIVAVVIAGLLLLAPQSVPPFTLLAAVGIALISWLDDHRSLSAAVRLTAHGTAAVVAIVECGPIEQMPLVGGNTLFLPPAVGFPLTFLWIVGLTNAYNFMDGIDGIAGLEGVIAGSSWAVAGALSLQPLPTWCGALLAGGCLGFLIHNWHPARIFMGDVGSAFLGYLFAVLPLVWRGAPAAGLAIGVLVVWPFVFDTVLTFIRRARAHQPLLRAHRSHLYQRLVRTGLRHDSVTVLYAALATSGGLLGITWLSRPAFAAIVGPIAVTVLAMMLWLYVAIREKYCCTAPKGIARSKLELP